MKVKNFLLSGKSEGRRKQCHFLGLLRGGSWDVDVSNVRVMGFWGFDFLFMITAIHQWFCMNYILLISKMVVMAYIRQWIRKFFVSLCNSLSSSGPLQNSSSTWSYLPFNPIIIIYHPTWNFWPISGKSIAKACSPWRVVAHFIFKLKHRVRTFEWKQSQGNHRSVWTEPKTPS